MLPNKTQVFDVESIRAAVRRDATVPAAMLQAALIKIHSKLDATEDKFFTWHGHVVETRCVAAHDIQIRAAEAIARIAGLMQAAPHAVAGRQRLTMEIDARGVMRLTIEEAVAAPEAPEASPESEQLALPITLPAEQAEPEPEIIKVRRAARNHGRTPPDVLRMLFDDEPPAP